jgi:hypothetical protein
VIQPILPLHKCADPPPTEYAVAESTTDPALVESAVAADPAPAEPLYSAAGAILTETS